MISGPVAGTYRKLGRAADFDARSRLYDSLAAQMASDLSTPEGRLLAADFKKFAKRSAHWERDAKISLPKEPALRIELTGFEDALRAVDDSLEPLRRYSTKRDELFVEGDTLDARFETLCGPAPWKSPGTQRSL